MSDAFNNLLNGILVLALVTIPMGAMSIIYVVLRVGIAQAIYAASVKFRRRIVRNQPPDTGGDWPAGVPRTEFPWPPLAVPTTRWVFARKTFRRSVVQERSSVLCASVLLLIFAALFLVMAVNLQLHGALRAASAMFLFISVMGLVGTQSARPSAKWLVHELAHGYLHRPRLAGRVVEDLWRAVIAQWSTGHYLEAASSIEVILQYHPHNVAVLLLAAEVCGRAGRFERAAEIGESIDAIRHLHPLTAHSLGLLLGMNERHDLALGFFDRALKSEAGLEQLRSNRGFVQLQLGNYGAAITDFDAVLIMNDKSSYAYANRGHALIKIGRTEDGLADIDHALALDERDAYAHMSLGLYHLDRGKYTIALEQFRKARAIDPATYRIDARIALAEAACGGAVTADGESEHNGPDGIAGKIQV